MIVARRRQSVKQGSGHLVFIHESKRSKEGSLFFILSKKGDFMPNSSL